MKTIIAALVFILSINLAVAQTDTAIAKTGDPIEMLFPQGKTKALILSYDDGRTEDRQLVKLMNKYGLIGTFHLNSNKLGTSGYVNKAEIKQLYTGHEVSVHSANHPNLTTLSKIDIVYEVVEDRKELERLIGYPVRGMAYPFGNNNEFVIDAIKGLGIEYARTVDDSYGFKIPENFLQWHPSVHQFAKAYWIPNDPENDKKELGRYYQLINDFMNTKELALLDIWGHSWEMGNNQNHWDETEKFFKLLANNSAIHYTTQIDLVDYINAFRNLKFSVEKNMVNNPSALTVFFKKSGKNYSVLPGKTIFLSN
ncbi:MAG: polysaccharide deacetylase family protein [Sphingobacteriales bacterium]|nr:polysaccharide deacetylase family protein [Sphingobacteriales bacterium]